MITNLFAGNESHVEFRLTDYTDIRSLAVATRGISNCGGVARTSGGLRRARTEIFNNANEDRSNVIVLITDGNLAHETDILGDEVRLVKRLDIKIVAVGITDKVSECATIISSSLNNNNINNPRKRRHSH